MLRWFYHSLVAHLYVPSQELIYFVINGLIDLFFGRLYIYVNLVTDFVFYVVTVYICNRKIVLCMTWWVMTLSFMYRWFTLIKMWLHLPSDEIKFDSAVGLYLLICPLDGDLRLVKMSCGILFISICPVDYMTTSPCGSRDFKYLCDIM